MEGLMLRVQKQTSSQNNDKGAVSKTNDSKSKRDGLPPKQLIVNRLALNKKDTGDAAALQKGRK